MLFVDSFSNLSDSRHGLIGCDPCSSRAGHDMLTRDKGLRPASGNGYHSYFRGMEICLKG